MKSLLLTLARESCVAALGTLGQRINLLQERPQDLDGFMSYNVLHREQYDDRRSVLSEATVVDDMYDMLAVYEQKVPTADQVWSPYVHYEQVSGVRKTKKATKKPAGTSPNLSGILRMIAGSYNKIWAFSTVKCQFLNYLMKLTKKYEVTKYWRCLGSLYSRPAPGTQSKSSPLFNCTKAETLFMCDQVKHDDLKEAAQSFMDELSAGKEFIADHKAEELVSLEGNIREVNDDLLNILGSLHQGIYINPETNPVDVVQDLEGVLERVAQLKVGPLPSAKLF